MRRERPFNDPRLDVIRLDARERRTLREAAELLERIRGAMDDVDGTIGMDAGLAATLIRDIAAYDAVPTAL